MLLLFGAALLSSCASPPPAAPPPPETFFDDASFSPPSTKLDLGAALRPSEAMERYVQVDMAPRIRRLGRRAALLEALASRVGLRVEYEAAFTRTAAQAFEERAGNCLALTLMTASFAKQLGLPVQYQSALIPNTWSRSDGLIVRSGHVNVSIGIESGAQDVLRPLEGAGVTVDFIPPAQLQAMRLKPIDEPTVMAMFMNNRAVEALASSRLDDAYWSAREALKQAPSFLASYNTLAVVYSRRGSAAQAERVWQALLERTPDDADALSNLAQLLDRLDRRAESATLRERLAKLRDPSPFQNIDLARRALEHGDDAAALALLQRDLARDSRYHESHFLLAVVHARLGEPELARKHLLLAEQYSNTMRDRALYAAKLESLRRLPPNIH